jgi:hypothetical protein
MKSKYLSYVLLCMTMFCFENVASADIGMCIGTCDDPYMELQSISPQQAYLGDNVTLTGIFKDAENLKVYLYVPYSKTSLPIKPKKVSDDRVTFVIPADLKLGDYSIYVDHDGSCKASCGSNSLSISVAEPIPVIDQIKMKGASKNDVLISGKKAYVYGKGFTQKLVVLLSTGESIEAKYISNTKVYFVIPSVEAGPKTIFVTVENEYGNKNSYAYQVSIVGENNVYKDSIQSGAVTSEGSAREALLKQIQKLTQLVAELLKKQALMKSAS